MNYRIKEPKQVVLHAQGGSGASRGEELHPVNHTLEPVAYVTGFYNGHCVIQPTNPAVVLPVGLALYRAPTECVRMTDEEMDEVVNRLQQEQALKEKNT